MKFWQPYLPAFLLVVLPIAGACATEPQSPPTPRPVDAPRLSPQEAISIAQEHSINAPLNIWGNQAGAYARRGGTQGWHADYVGNGKWTAELWLGKSDNYTIYRWSVFESDLTAVFLGAYKGN